MYSTEQVKLEIENYIVSTGKIFTSTKRGDVIYIRIQVLANKVLEIKCNIPKNELKLSVKRMVHLVGNRFTYNEVVNSAEVTSIDFRKDGYMDILVQVYHRYINTKLIKLLSK